jgi:hypothetical protein
VAKHAELQERHLRTKPWCLPVMVEKLFARNTVIKLTCWLFPLAVGVVINNVVDAAHAQDPSTVIRVLDASGVEAIAGIVLLVNPGDSRNSQIFVTNAQGEAIAHGLQCGICTVSAFDPRGLFTTRTTEFSSSSPAFSLIMQLHPVVDTVGDPKALLIELVIHDSKDRPLAHQNLVIRQTTMTFEDNCVSVQRTDSMGHVNTYLRAGDYTVGVLIGESASEIRFEVKTKKKQCSGATVTCVVASAQSSHLPSTVRLQLPSGN